MGSLSPTDWLAILGFVFALLGTGVTMIWQTAVLVQEVKGLRKDVNEINKERERDLGQQHEINVAFKQWHRRHDNRFKRHHQRLNDLEGRHHAEEFDDDDEGDEEDEV